MIRQGHHEKVYAFTQKNRCQGYKTESVSSQTQMHTQSMSSWSLQSNGETHTHQRICPRRGRRESDTALPEENTRGQDPGGGVRDSSYLRR